jgi:two-component system sensor histidine kinase and response regulator WspE
MSSDSGLEDLPLIDLFRAEVETHTEVLNTALLALEKSPGDTSRISEMMRAAHSIKGAARVVGVDPAVSVAHVMEDCFVDAQKGALALSPAVVDVLLRGVDLLSKISEATRDDSLDLAVVFDDAVKTLVVELEALRGSGQLPVASCQLPVGGGRPELTSGIPRSAFRIPHSDAISHSDVPLTIHFPGVLDATAAEEARGQLLAALGRGRGTVWFDLGETKDLDVQGLAFLAAVPQYLSRHGLARVRLARLSAEMETVLKVTGLNEPYASAPGARPEDQ